VDDTLKTTNQNVYAIGDVIAANLLKSSCVAEYFGEIAIKNALLNKGIEINTNYIPTIINVYPKIAFIGLMEEQLDEAKVDYDIYIEHNKLSVKYLISGEDTGFTKIIAKKGTYEILGALIINTKADELINEVGLYIKFGLKLNQIEKGAFINGTCNRTFLHIAKAAKFKKHFKGKQFSLLKNPVDIDHNDKLVFGYLARGCTTFGPAYFK